MKQEEIIEPNRTKLQRFAFDNQRLPYLKGFGFDHSPAEYYWDAKERAQSLLVFQYTLSGVGYLETPAKMYELKANTFFLAELPQRFTYYRGEEEWSFVYLEFSPEFLQWIDQPLEVQTCAEDFIAPIIAQLNQLLPEKADLYANSRCAYELFLTIKKYLAHADSSAPSQAIKAYLETHYQEELSLDQLAERFQLSKYQIIRLFEKNYQQTPISYLNKYRMIQSLRYLGTPTPIKEIAQLVGFSDHNYFSRVFKKEIGMTPSAYRKGLAQKSM